MDRSLIIGSALAIIGIGLPYLAKRLPKSVAAVLVALGVTLMLWGLLAPNPKANRYTAAAALTLPKP